MDNGEQYGVILEGTEDFLKLINNQRGDDFEIYFGTAMYEYSDAVAVEALRLRREWGADSNTPISRSIEQYVAQMLGVAHQHYAPPPYPLNPLSDLQKEAVRAIYGTTQKILKAKKVSHLILYRGLGWDKHQSRPHFISNEAELGDIIETPGRTLTSWSFDRAIAEEFATKHVYGCVIKSQVPLSQIFAIIDVDFEQESVCIYNNEAEIVSIIKPREDTP